MTTVRLGVAGGPMPSDPAAVTADLLDELHTLGVRAIAAAFPAPAETLTASVVDRLRGLFEESGIAVAQLAGHNAALSHGDADRRRVDLERLRRGFGIAAALGAEAVITGCGSMHPDHFYGPDPRNHGPEARRRLVMSLRAAADFAADSGVPLSLECHVLTTLDSASHIREVLDEVDSPWVRANFDPVNLLGSLAEVYASGAAVRRAAAMIGPRLAPTCHVKDVTVSPGLVLHIDEAAPGTGMLDLDAVFDVVRGMGDGAALLVEHLDAADARQALQWLIGRVERAGLTLA